MLTFDDEPIEEKPEVEPEEDPEEDPKEDLEKEPEIGEPDVEYGIEDVKPAVYGDDTGSSFGSGEKPRETIHLGIISWTNSFLASMFVVQLVGYMHFAHVMSLHIVRRILPVA